MRRLVTVSGAVYKYTYLLTISPCVWKWDSKEVKKLLTDAPGGTAALQQNVSSFPHFLYIPHESRNICSHAVGLV